MTNTVLSGICKGCRHGREYHGVRGHQCKFVIASTTFDVLEPLEIMCRCVKFIEDK